MNYRLTFWCTNLLTLEIWCAAQTLSDICLLNLAGIKEIGRIYKSTLFKVQ